MLEQLKQYAMDHHIPIICDEGLLFLDVTIKKYQVKDVLEIGTAIGYSALAMASFGCKIDTFERNIKMIEHAKEHFNQYDHKNQIHLFPYDALDYQGELKSYDMIFIDAAKAQYQNFFEKFVPYLKPNGIVVCDNLSFHHLKPELVNRNTRQLIRKINAFKTFLIENPDFETTFYNQGDGMSVSQRKRI
jgi:predicted O-methyltransferase YrrM